jgi:2-keto-4-pentenoate hydratase/2-oxohepta-3-ene-1,7-dioic acid hydratase in catechol pathway
VKIIRFEHEGQAAAGVDHGDDYEVVRDALDPTPTGLSVPRPVTLLPPIVPTDILCIGLNYREHAAETDSTVPEHPMLFIKSSNALAGPEATVILPQNSDRVDYEAELAVVIGRDAKDVAEADAAEYVAGYTIANDISARDWQKDQRLNGGQFARGKSFDGFCPLGPHLVTPDDVGDPNNLDISLTLNGETMQSSNTSDMIFSVPQIIASLSHTMTIRRGSVILTGTPSGVGAARRPPVFLKPGDETVVEIEKLGRLVTQFAAAS